jgi:hypothetical protein
MPHDDVGTTGCRPFVLSVLESCFFILHTFAMHSFSRSLSAIVMSLNLTEMGTPSFIIIQLP